MICDFEDNNGRYIIKAPSIGRVTLSIKLHEPVAGGQVIGTLKRLNQCFDLRLSDDCLGEVSSLKSADLDFAVSYGEPICELSTISKASKNVESTPKSAEKYIDSPLDGLFYLSASPDSPAYVKVGDEITPGQILGLIEVMKCFYPLKYQGESKVKIVHIKVKNQSPVVSGTHLFAIE